jgi:head-tail adaptor
MRVGHLLSRRLQVWRPVTAPDGAGGHTTEMVPQPAPVRAKVDQPSTRERMLAAQASSEHTHTVYLLPAADVRRGDQLRDAGTGEAWRVLAVAHPSTPIYRRAECQLIQSEGEPDG